MGIALIGAILGWKMGFFAVLVYILIGAFQWSLLTSEMTLKAIMVYSFVAFIPKDIMITMIGVLLGRQIRKPLVKAVFLK